MALDGNDPLSTHGVILAALLGAAIVPTNTLEIIGVQSNQVMQSGSSTFTKGTRAITFVKAFGTPPVCVCTDAGGSPAECASGAPTLRGVTFYGKSNAGAFGWICVGGM